MNIDISSMNQSRAVIRDNQSHVSLARGREKRKEKRGKIQAPIRKSHDKRIKNTHMGHH